MPTQIDFYGDPGIESGDQIRARVFLGVREDLKQDHNVLINGGDYSKETKEMFNQNPLVLKERRPRRKRWVETYFVYVPRKPWTYETAVLLHKLRDDEVVRIWRGICEQ